LSFSPAHAVASCPGGPVTQTFVGRKDATAAAPPGQLPPADAPGDEALAKFKAQGFTAEDLGALIGAHTTSRQFVTDPSKAGASQDSTPGIWDILYYTQTILKKAPFTFQADANLAVQAEVGPVMQRFTRDVIGWNRSFAAAMAKLEMLGSTNKAAMVDCTSALPRGLFIRDSKTAAINARV
jgi:hypothetical protein